MSRGSNPTKAQRWSDRLERFESSGQTIAQFCVVEGVSQSSFYKWKNNLAIGNRLRGGRSNRSGKGNRSEKPNRENKNKPAFKPVQLTPTPGHLQSTTIRLTDGVEIELGDNLQVVDIVVRSVVNHVLSNGAARAGGTLC
jgi:hypothetical protein